MIRGKGPLVSIIIPVLNRENFIKQTIDSLISQEYENWEALIIDDGSIDRTCEIVKEIHFDDKRINFIQKHKGLKPGAPAGRNYGIRKSKGKYIIFLDSDDCLAAFCLVNRVKVMELDSELDFAVFSELIFYDKPGDSDVLVNIKKDKSDIDRFLNFRVNTDVPWVNTGPIWRRGSLKKYNHYWNEDTKGYQDVEYHLYGLIKRMNYKVIDSIPDCFWRQHNGDRIRNTLSDFDVLVSTEHMLFNIIDILIASNKLTETRKMILTEQMFSPLVFRYIYYREYSRVIRLINNMKNRNIIDDRKNIELHIYLLLNIPLFFSNKLRRYLMYIIQNHWNFVEKDKNESDFMKHKFIFR
jgi:glycosyltransferase involved in cell wall biosynthesis